MKKRVIIILSSLVLLVTIIIGGLTIFSKNKIQDTNGFSILNVTNNNSLYSVSFEEVKDVDYYSIEVFDNENKAIVDIKTQETNNEIELANLVRGNKYKVVVTAFKDGKLTKAKEDYTFVWNEPYIAEDNSLILNNEDYNLKIDGDIKDKNYHLILKNNDEIILDDIIKDNVYTIPESLYKDKEMVINASTVINDVVTSEFTLYNKTNPIEKISIKKPSNNAKFVYKDITGIDVEFEGGNNASYFELIVYDGSKEIIKEKILSNKVIIDKSKLENNKKYLIEIKGTYQEYERTSSINVTIGTIAQPVLGGSSSKDDGTNKEIPVKDGEEKGEPSASGIVALAQKQIGNKGGKKFWSWYGYNGRVEWCAIFITWLARHSGLDSDIIPSFINVGVGFNWFKKRNQVEYGGGKYIPKKGDIIFFDWNVNKRIDHVGIVKDVSNGKVITIEGNSSDACKEKSYPVDSKYIYGYGIPKYPK